MRKTLTIILTLAILAGGHLAQGEPPAAKDTQKETIPFTTPAEALKRIVPPPGFRVSLFAAEPNVRQPISLTTDARGRLWVAENNTYAERELNFDDSQCDRITILEDTDGDGQADRTKVFWDQAKKLTSVEVGFGGVWALCPPALLFIPDRDGDDVPDGEPQVVLDGFDAGDVRHNISNGLKWGPDGWLYGRHGILVTSQIGAPGTPPAGRTPINCGIWRYHPTQKIFEVVCHGTTNSWGLDWNRHGEPFFINTVIGHLWHAIPGAHFERMYGEDDNPHLYSLIGQTADHFHWDTKESWHAIRDIGVSPSTDQAGGGHAHCGLMIYQGDNWPERYRDTVFTVNLHGFRLNNDTLQRSGAGYVAHHAADFLKTSDPWFRGIDLVSGPDGGVYLADWSDIGECHDNDGVHRSSGRIFKIVYGTPPRRDKVNVAALEDLDLVALLFNANDWYVRQARQALQQRAAAGRPMDRVQLALRNTFATARDPVHKLRALWCLHAIGKTDESWLLDALRQGDEHVRSWVVRLLVDVGPASSATVAALTSLAADEPSGLVQIYLASALQKIAPADRWTLAERLAAGEKFAADPVLTKMVWYGIESAVPDHTARAIGLAERSKMPLLVRCVARRLTENLATDPAAVNQWVAATARSNSTAWTREALAGMDEALRGQRKAPVPAAWPQLKDAMATNSDQDVQRLVRELSVVFGDGRALDDLKQIAAAKSADPQARRDAIRVLVDARAAGLSRLLQPLVGEREVGAEAVRGLAACDEAEVPTFLVQNFAGLRDTGQAAAIVTLTSRTAWARSLLDAVAAGKIDRGRIPAFELRQMSTSSDEQLRRQVAALWPELRAISVVKKERIGRLKQSLGSETLATADASNGRRRFVQSCATCHVLFGEGAKIGPDLTGSQRANLDYLLENIVDPSATVAAGYRISTVTLSDGRIIGGLVQDTGGPTLSIQTPTERLIISRTDVEANRASELSLMPDSLLDVLPEKEIRDLIAYLMSPRQVPLPPGATSPGSPAGR